MTSHHDGPPTERTEPATVRERLEAALLADDEHTARRLEALVRHDAELAELAPEIAAIDLGSGGGLHKDLLWHSVRVAAKVPPRLRLRLAALLHDVGKPDTRRVEGREVTFRDHEWVGAELVRRALPRLGYAAELVEQVATIVEMSGRFKQSDQFSDSAVRRYVADAGEVLEDLLVLCELDVTSKHAVNHQRQAEQVARLRERIDEVRRSDQRRAERPVLDGRAVMQLLDVEPGPVVGRALAMLLDHERAQGPLAESEARQLLAAWHAEQRAS